MKTRMQELLDELRELQAAEKALDEATRKAKSDAYHALPYEWRVQKKAGVIGGTFCQLKHLFPSYPKGAVVEMVYVSRRRAGYDPALHGVQTHADKWDGMTYMRTEEGILYHEGGGTFVLYDPLLITLEAWEELKAGNIPEQFKRP